VKKAQSGDEVIRSYFGLDGVALALKTSGWDHPEPERRDHSRRGQPDREDQFDQQAGPVPPGNPVPCPNPRQSPIRSPVSPRP
jgi:hypothetical protein